MSYIVVDYQAFIYECDQFGRPADEVSRYSGEEIDIIGLRVESLEDLLYQLVVFEPLLEFAEVEYVESGLVTLVGFFINDYVPIPSRSLQSEWRKSGADTYTIHVDIFISESGPPAFPDAVSIAID